MNNIRAAAIKAKPWIIITMAIAVMALGIPIAAYAQSNQQDWKQSPTGLNVTAGDNAGELNLTWDPHTQTSKTLSDYRVTWTPDGEAFKTNDQTEWYAYPTTNEVTVTGLEAGATYKVRVRARYDDGRKSKWSDVVSGQSGVTPNSPATGQPTISGTAEVGDTLTAGTSAIADDNGLTNAVFSHQWVRSTAGSHTDIPGATNASYVITPADAESKIKVRVSFTDDDGYLETLTSAATASVPEPESDVVPGQSGVTPNSPATGQPTISGTTEVGDTLTAGTSAIADDNGLTNAVFSHQWVRSTAGSHTDIPGATNASYVITPADAESKIKVRVSFTDDDGYLETLTSAATASVPEPEGEQPQRDKGDGYDQNATPRSGHPAAASPCPAVNDWCTTMTVADAEGDGLLHGYEFDKFGSIVDDTIQPGGANINVWTVHTFAHPHPQLPDYIFFGSNPRVPRGTQVTIEGHTFIADAESHDGEEGDTGDKWEFPSGELPASLVWSDRPGGHGKREACLPVRQPGQQRNRRQKLAGRDHPAGRKPVPQHQAGSLQELPHRGHRRGRPRHARRHGTLQPHPGGPGHPRLLERQWQIQGGYILSLPRRRTREERHQADNEDRPPHLQDRGFLRQTTAPAPTSSRSGSTTSAGSTTTATLTVPVGQEAPRDTPPTPTCSPERADAKSF